MRPADERIAESSALGRAVALLLLAMPPESRSVALAEYETRRREALGAPRVPLPACDGEDDSA